MRGDDAHRSEGPDFLQGIINAVDNASQTPAQIAEIAEIIRTGDGAPSHVRAIFGDCPLPTLLNAAEHYGVSSKQLARAWLFARRRHKAANAEMDEWLAASPFLVA